MIHFFLFSNGSKVKILAGENRNENFYQNVFIEHIVQSLNLEFEEKEEGQLKTEQQDKRSKQDVSVLGELAMSLMSTKRVEDTQPILDRYAVGFGLDRIVFYNCNELTNLLLIKRDVIKTSCIIIPVFSSTEVYGFIQFIGPEKSESFYKILGIFLATSFGRILDNERLEYFLEQPDYGVLANEKKSLIVSVNIPEEVYFLCDKERIINCSFSDCYSVSDNNKPSLILIKQTADIDFLDVVELSEKIRDLPELSTVKIFFFWNDISSTEIKKYQSRTSFVFCNETMLKIKEYRKNLIRLIQYDYFLSNEVINEFNKVLFETETNLKKDGYEALRDSDISACGMNFRFVRYFGLTLLEYKKIYRIIIAKQMIDESKIVDIDQIISLCGYTSKRSFSFEFNKHFEMTLSEYIRKKNPEIAKNKNNR